MKRRPPEVILREMDATPGIVRRDVAPPVCEWRTDDQFWLIPCCGEPEVTEIAPQYWNDICPRCALPILEVDAQ